MALLHYIFYWSLILHGLINSCVYGERCLSCTEVIEPRHCNVAVECGQNEICFTQKYTDISGEVLYNVGCLDNMTCTSLNGNSFPVQTFFGQQQNKILGVSCQQCCKGTACNLNGCGAKDFPRDKGLLCFQCKQHRKASSCLTFEECFGIGARCYVETFEEYGDRFYQHGCTTNKHCSSDLSTTVNIGNVFGKKRHVKSSTLLNMTCCNSDFCNHGIDTTSTKKSHYGKEFLLSFPSSSNDTDAIEILISGMEDTKVTLNSPVVGVNRTVVVTAARGLSVFLPKDLVYKRNTTATTYRTVKVLSVHDVSLYVIFYRQNITLDGYLAKPKESFRRNYSFTLPQNSHIAITASDDATRIEMIMYFVNDSSSRNYTFIASASQTVYVFVGESDKVAYGHIEASSNINVVTAASDYNSIDSPLPLLSQKSFVLPVFSPFDGYVCTDGTRHTQRIISSQAPDLIYPYIAFRNHANLTITASINGHMDCLGADANSMAYFPSISTYTNSYIFKTPTAKTIHHFATLISQKNTVKGIRDNGQVLTSVGSSEVNFENEMYKITTIQLQSGMHIIAHADIKAKFGLVLYGISSPASDVVYAYPAGFEINP